MSDLLRAVGRDLFDAAVAEGEAIRARRAAEAGSAAGDAASSPRAFDYVALERRMRDDARLDHIEIIRARAENYIDDPRRLDALDGGRLGLSTMHPRRALAFLASLEEQERQAPRRFHGFGSEVPLLNIKAAMLALRWRRRFDERPALVAAE